MKHKSQARYPAPAEVVLRMFTDKAFHTGKLDAMGLKNYQVLDHVFDGQDFRIRIQRKVPMQAPAVVKKFVGAESTVVNEERWNLKSRTGRVLVEPVGMPIEMSCQTSLRDQGDGCVVDFEWTINARVPLVGGALEKFVVGDLEKRAGEETALAVRMLERYR
ncbi:MAG TPA: DUF2505 domain-containing protein [Nevskia sp.]|nr:DUF2505 domain-containing protein [Nevskia sp.]